MSLDRELFTEVILFVQNHRIDGEHGGWSWCESCGSALEFLAAAASLGPDVAMDLKGRSLSCPWDFVQLGASMSNSR